MKEQTERIPCLLCGAMILPSTAERTGGICAPCSKQSDGSIYRLKIEYRPEADKRGSTNKTLFIVNTVLCAAYPRMSLRSTLDAVRACRNGKPFTVTVNGSLILREAPEHLEPYGFHVEILETKTIAQYAAEKNNSE